MKILVYGINYKRVPVEIREQVSLSETGRELILHIIREEGIAEEAMVLDTCNRTEFYLVGADRKTALEHLLVHIGEVNKAETLPDSSYFYSLTGRKAVRHLFRTGASLDSQVVGETEVLGQLKDAYRTALDCGTARFVLNKTLHKAFGASKRVQSETSLCEGAASISTSAVQMLSEDMGGLKGSKILVIGAGKTAETAVRVLAGKELSEGICANRSVNSAEEMLKNVRQSLRKDTVTSLRHSNNKKRVDEKCSKTTLPDEAAFPWAAAGLDALPESLSRVDGVITATGAEGSVLKGDEIIDVLRERDEMLHIVDVAVPRDVDPTLAKLNKVLLRDIDDLNVVINKSMEIRRSELPRAEAIVEQELEKFYDWIDSLRVVPTIKKLKAFANRQQQKEIERQCKMSADQDRRDLQRFSEGLIAKLLHRPFSYLNQISTERSESEVMAAMNVIHEMFGLDEDE